MQKMGEPLGTAAPCPYEAFVATSMSMQKMGEPLGTALPCPYEAIVATSMSSQKMWRGPFPFASGRGALVPTDFSVDYAVLREPA